MSATAAVEMYGASYRSLDAAVFTLLKIVMSPLAERRDYRIRTRNLSRRDKISYEAFIVASYRSLIRDFVLSKKALGQVLTDLVDNGHHGCNVSRETETLSVVYHPPQLAASFICDN
eukprot:sb/3476492/